jgi:hypothetical protein
MVVTARSTKHFEELSERACVLAEIELGSEGLFLMHSTSFRNSSSPYKCSSCNQGIRCISQNLPSTEDCGGFDSYVWLQTSWLSISFEFFLVMLV